MSKSTFKKPDTSNILLVRTFEQARAKTSNYDYLAFEDRKDLDAILQLSKYTTDLYIIEDELNLNRLTPNGKKLLTEKLLSLPNLRKFISLPGLLTAKQEQQISTHANKNKEIFNEKCKLANEKKARSNFQETRSLQLWMLIGATIGLISAVILAQPITATLALMVFSTSIAYLIKDLIEEKAKSTSRHIYDRSREESIRALVFGNNISAAKAGLEANTWPGYFASYGEPSTYRHYATYRAAMHLAREENNEAIEAIRNIPSPKPHQ